jgi:hypothetical protein
MTDRSSGIPTKLYTHRTHTEVVEVTMDGSFIAVRSEMGRMP